MENDPTTPKLESSTLNLEEDILDAVANERSDDEESFVIAEESMITKDPMTQSKYAQVVFLEISDRYPNDSNILCKFTHNFDVIEESINISSDRIGLYRVPDFAPHQYLAYRWVSEAEKIDKNSFSLDFKELPKVEDFYQFQFLRTENGIEAAIGASVPFLLQNPKNEELCTVENDEEFMIVRSRTSLQTEKMSNLSSDNVSLNKKLEEMESKYRNLLEFSEKLQADLEEKSKMSQDFGQLKADLTAVLQEKEKTEEKLHRHVKALKTLQIDRDLLTGEKDQAIREKELLKEERDQILSQKQEKIRNLMLKSDEQLRKIQILEERNANLDKLNKDLLQINSEQKAIVEKFVTSQNEESSAKAKIAELEFSKNAEIEELRLAMEELQENQKELKGKLQRKEREFEVLTVEMFERSKSKFGEIDVLKKQLSEAERNLNKISTETLKMDENSSVDPDNILGKVSEIEKTVKQTQKELQEFIYVSRANSEIASLRSQEALSSLDSQDSRRFLDDQVIENALHRPDDSSPFKKIIKGFSEMEDSPKITEDRTDERSPLERGATSFLQFLPQLVQSVSGHLSPNSDDQKVVQEQPKPEAEDLINFQSNFVLTDDGKTVTENEAKPKCPICEKIFEIGEIAALQLHVDGHLASSLFCPLCNASFENVNREIYQKHVQEHFAEEDEQRSWFMDFD